MSTRHVRTAFDLVSLKLGLAVKCLACGHVLTLDGYEVAREIDSLELCKLELRLKCTHCGVKNVQIAILHPPAPRN